MGHSTRFRLASGSRTNCDSMTAMQKNWQTFAHKEGIALRGHAASAHDGKIDESCPACRELLEKMKER